MQTKTITTNLTCNERCNFCDARDDAHDPVRFARERIERQIRDALADGATELVLTGGEPTLRADLAQLIKTAKESGAQRVVLETNGLMLAYPATVEALVAAGLDVARIGLNAWGAASDVLSQRPGGFELTCRGVDNALAQGLAVELSCAVQARNLESVAALPRRAAARFNRIDGFYLHLVTSAPSPIDALSIAPIGALLVAAQAMIDACREVGLACHVCPQSAVSPCWVRRRRQYPQLLRALGHDAAAGHLRVPACATCAVADSCAGVKTDINKIAAALRPEAITARDTRFALAAGGDRRASADQLLLSSGHFVDASGNVRNERVVRVNFHCNQDCTFCFVDRSLPAVGSARIDAEIQRASQDGVGLLSLSGGEPTLDPQLSRHIAHACGLGLRVQVQTNAVVLDNDEHVRQLAAAGLHEAFVSLHGASAAVSDKITGRPGTFLRTLAGVTNLLAHGVKVRLNCVITGANLDDLGDIADLIAERFDGEPELVLSWASASTDLVPVNSDVTPRASDVVPLLRQLVARCRERSVQWRGFEGECGVPLCLLDDDLLQLERVPVRPSTAPPAGFMKVAVCDTCVLSERCPGLRESYAAVHGVDELRALPRQFA